MADLGRRLRHALGDGRGSESLARPMRRPRSSSAEGGRTNTRHEIIAHRLDECSVPCQSISNSMSRPGRPPARRRLLACRSDGRTPRPIRGARRSRPCGESLIRDEVIIPAVDLALARRASGDRHRHLDVRIALQQPPRQRCLAGARWRRQHQQEPAAGVSAPGSGASSMFCTCWRN